MGPIKCSLSVMDWNQQVYPCTSATWRDSGNWVIIIIIYSWLTWLFWPAAISLVPSMAVQRLHVMGTGEPFDCYQHCHGQAKIYIFLILTNTLHHLHQSRYGFLSMLYVNEKKIKFTGIQVLLNYSKSQIWLALCGNLTFELAGHMFLLKQYAFKKMFLPIPVNYSYLVKIFQAV